MNDTSTSLLTEHFSYTPLVGLPFLAELYRFALCTNAQHPTC